MSAHPARARRAEKLGAGILELPTKERIAAQGSAIPRLHAKSRNASPTPSLPHLAIKEKAKTGIREMQSSLVRRHSHSNGHAPASEAAPSCAEVRSAAHPGSVARQKWQDNAHDYPARRHSVGHEPHVPSAKQRQRTRARAGVEVHPVETHAHSVARAAATASATDEVALSVKCHHSVPPRTSSGACNDDESHSPTSVLLDDDASDSMSISGVSGMSGVSSSGSNTPPRKAAPAALLHRLDEAEGMHAASAQRVMFIERTMRSLEVAMQALEQEKAARRALQSTLGALRGEWERTERELAQRCEALENEKAKLEEWKSEQEKANARKQWLLGVISAFLGGVVSLGVRLQCGNCRG